MEPFMSSPIAAPLTEAHQVLTFWFADAHENPKSANARARLWFRASRDFDREIAERGAEIAAEGAADRLAAWALTPGGALAHVLVLDQFARNLHRGTPNAFACDPLALSAAREAITAGFDEVLRPLERAFLYMPMQHAEDLAVQEEGVARYRELHDRADPEWQKVLRSFRDAAVEHRDIIARFGRFPHRNAILGRGSTEAEDAYLEGGAPRFGQAAR
jgi:uncharacterized protein (DUF924 family)